MAKTDIGDSVEDAIAGELFELLLDTVTGSADGDGSNGAD